MLFFCFEAFWENSQRTSFLYQKVNISENSTEMLTKFVFLNKFEEWQILREIWICLNKHFWSNQLNVGNIYKNLFFSSKSTYSWTMLFCCFDAFFGEIHRELLFLVKKVTFSGSSTEILRKLVFLTYLIGVNPEENLDCLNNSFWSNQKNWENI